MQTIELCLCDRCKTPILGKKEGFIIQGNIYVADASSTRGGLVGNAFPDVSEDGTIMASDIKEYCFCKSCFKSVLEL